MHEESNFMLSDLLYYMLEITLNVSIIENFVNPDKYLCLHIRKLALSVFMLTLKCFDIGGCLYNNNDGYRI